MSNAIGLVLSLTAAAVGFADVVHLQKGDSLTLGDTTVSCGKPTGGFCSRIAGAVYCTQETGQTCTFLEGSVYCGRGCSTLGGEVYCGGGPWQSQR